MGGEEPAEQDREDRPDQRTLDSQGEAPPVRVRWPDVATRVGRGARGCHPREGGRIER